MADRPPSPPPLEADGVHDPEVDKHREALDAYLATLSEEQALTYKIAYSCLGHSYTVVRSQGFLAFLKKWEKPMAKETAAESNDTKRVG
jgi:hypothetical protein